MHAALYTPGLGYYMTIRDRFGSAGDFTTSPELSPLFARCLAVQIAEIFERTGGGDLIEHGAGSGASHSTCWKRSSASVHCRVATASST